MAIKLPKQGIHIATVDLIVRADIHREVAVEAFGFAEGDVKVEQGLWGVAEPVLCPRRRCLPEVLEEVLSPDRVLNSEVVGVGLHETQPCCEREAQGCSRIRGR